MIEISIDKINDLIVIDQATLPQIFAEGNAGLIVDKIEKDVRSFVLEVETAKGRKDIASVAYKIARAKKTIDDAGKQISGEYKAKAKAFDQERSQLWSRLESLQAEIRAPLNDFEEKEKIRINNHKEALLILEGFVELFLYCIKLSFDTDSMLNEAIKNCDTFFARDWEEFKDDAIMARDKTISMLKSLTADRKLKIAEEKIAMAEEKLRLLEEAETKKLEEEIRKEQERKIIEDVEIEKESEKKRGYTEKEAALYLAVSRSFLR